MRRNPFTLAMSKVALVDTVVLVDSPLSEDQADIQELDIQALDIQALDIQTVDILGQRLTASQVQRSDRRTGKCSQREE